MVYISFPIMMKVSISSLLFIFVKVKLCRLFLYVNMMSTWVFDLLGCRTKLLYSIQLTVYSVIYMHTFKAINRYVQKTYQLLKTSSFRFFPTTALLSIMWITTWVSKHSWIPSIEQGIAEPFNGIGDGDIAMVISGNMIGRVRNTNAMSDSYAPTITSTMNKGIFGILVCNIWTHRTLTLDVLVLIGN